MKKLLLATFAILSFSAQASDYAAECKHLIDLTFEAAEVMPEMKASLGMTKEEMTKMSLDAWEKMSSEEKKQAEAGCKASVEQMKTVIDAAKAAK